MYYDLKNQFLLKLLSVALGPPQPALCPAAVLPKAAVVETSKCSSTESQMLLALPDRTLCHARCDISNDAVTRKVEYKCVCNTGIQN
jgi:hypothetical protein